jgi:hypothetical protein
LNKAFQDRWQKEEKDENPLGHHDIQILDQTSDLVFLSASSCQSSQPLRQEALEAQMITTKWHPS